MTDDALTLAARKLDWARQSGDADDLAEALVLHANELIKRAEFGIAQQELDEAAQIHHTRGRAYDEARCIQFAATAARFAGKLEDAKHRAQRSLEVISGSGPIAVSAYTELGEIALAQGDGYSAAAAYRSALERGNETGLIAPAKAALLRRRAAALVLAQSYRDAVDSLQAAFQLYIEAGDHADATRTVIEQATAFQHAGMVSDAEGATRRALDLAEKHGDDAALADVYLLFATQALEHHDPAGAMELAQTARQHALAANMPTSYIGAVVTIAELAELAGDRFAAYEALAVGWVTLADLLGNDIAKDTFAPRLKELRERWGAPDFENVKAKYEEHRRRVQQRRP